MNAPNRWTPLGIVLAIVLLCGGVLVLILKPDRGSRWVSDPAAQRNSAVYVSMLGPARSSPAVEQFDARADVIRNGSEIIVEVPQSRPSSEGDRVYGYTLHRAGSDQRAVFPGGSVCLSYLGIAYGAFPVDDPRRDSVSVPARFFDANLRPVESKRLQELVPSERDRLLSFRGDFPEVRFSFLIEGPSEFKILNVQVFDVRTHRSLLGGGYSWGAGEGGRFWVGARVQIWHQSPVLVVLSLAHGPAKTNLVKAAVGATAKHDQGELRLVGIFRQIDPGWSIESATAAERLTLRLADPAQTNRPAQTTFVWYGIPQASPIPLELDYLDADGAVLADRGRGSSGAFLLSGFPEPAQKVSSVRIRSFPHIRRLVFYLPEIPGLPEENRGVQNLFDVRIPYVRIKEDRRMREFLANVTELEPRFSQMPSAIPGFFPFARTNILVREVAAQYKAALSGAQQVRVSPNEQHFILQPSASSRFRKHLREFLDQLF